MLTVPFFNIQANPLDSLLYALGVRLSSLAKSADPDFVKLIDGKAVTLHFCSQDGVSRHYIVKDNRISQALGTPAHADLTVTFKDAMTGAKLLAKADTVSLMSAIQSGDMAVSGDYKLVLWFASLTKHLTKLPAKYQPYADKAKPYWDKAKPTIYQLTTSTKKTLGKLAHKFGR